MPFLSLEDFETKLEQSVVANRLGIRNEIPEHYGDRVIELYHCYRVISDLFIIGISRSIYITSGYRCAELNKAVGGVSGSKHCECKAFDFGFSSVACKSDFSKCFDALKINVVRYHMRAGLSFDEALLMFRKHFIADSKNLVVHFQRS